MSAYLSAYLSANVHVPEFDQPFDCAGSSKSGISLDELLSGVSFDGIPETLSGFRNSEDDFSDSRSNSSSETPVSSVTSLPPAGDTFDEFLHQAFGSVSTNVDVEGAFEKAVSIDVKVEPVCSATLSPYRYVAPTQSLQSFVEKEPVATGLTIVVSAGGFPTFSVSVPSVKPAFARVARGRPRKLSSGITKSKTTTTKRLLRQKQIARSAKLDKQAELEKLGAQLQNLI